MRARRSLSGRGSLTSMVLAIIMTLARVPLAIAQVLPSPLGVRDVARIARERRQEVAASSARARALAQRPRIQGSLEQPMLMLGIDHLPFALHGADLSVAVQQDFPLSGLLSRRREAAEADARRARAAVGVAALDVELEATEALVMVAERRRLRGVLSQQSALARELTRASAARYASGQGSQAEVLRSEAEAARVEALAAANARLVVGAEAMLRAALGIQGDASIPEVDLAEAEIERPTVATLVETSLASRPELGAQRAERARAQAEVSVMEAMFAPMAFVRVGAATTMQDGPGVMTMLGLSLPLWRGRLHAGVAEARSMRSMADAELAAMRTMVEGEVRARHAEVLAARTALESYRSRVVPLTRQAFDATAASYAAGQVPMVAAIEALRMLTMTLEEEVMAEVRLARASVLLERAVGTIGATR